MSILSRVRYTSHNNNFETDEYSFEEAIDKLYSYFPVFVCSGGYCFFMKKRDNETYDKNVGAELGRVLNPTDIDVILGKEIEEDENEQRRNKTKQILLSAVKNYKIHLMPQKLELFIPKLAQFFEKNKDLVSVIGDIKIKTIMGGLLPTRGFECIKDTNKRLGMSPDMWAYLCPYQVDDDVLVRGKIFPKIVIYTIGKEVTQKVINRLYFFLKDQKDSEVIKEAKDKNGKCVPPRYNARITNLLWVAQGNGDDKNFPSLFQEPHKLYFSEDIATSLGLDKDYFYLHHPETGEILNDPGENC